MGEQVEGGKAFHQPLMHSYLSPPSMHKHLIFSLFHVVYILRNSLFNVKEEDNFIIFPRFDHDII